MLNFIPFYLPVGIFYMLGRFAEKKLLEHQMFDLFFIQIIAMEKDE